MCTTKTTYIWWDGRFVKVSRLDGEGRGGEEIHHRKHKLQFVSMHMAAVPQVWSWTHVRAKEKKNYCFHFLQEI